MKISRRHQVLKILALIAALSTVLLLGQKFRKSMPLSIDRIVTSSTQSPTQFEMVTNESLRDGGAHHFLAGDLKDIRLVDPHEHASLGELYKNLPTLLENLARVSSTPLASKIHVLIVDDMAKNAFYYRDREGRTTVAITLGMIKKRANDHQIAFILGHELSHSPSEIQKNGMQAKSINRALPNPITAALARRTEFEADLKSSLELLVKAKYDAYESLKVAEDFAAHELEEAFQDWEEHPMGTSRGDAMGFGLAIQRRVLGYGIAPGKAEQPSHWIKNAALTQYLDSKAFEKKRLQVYESRKAEIIERIRKRFQSIRDKKELDDKYTFEEAFQQLFKAKMDLTGGDSNRKSLIQEFDRQLVELDGIFEAIRKEILGEAFKPQNLDQTTALIQFESRPVFGMNEMGLKRAITLRNSYKKRLRPKLFGGSSASKEERESLKKDIKLIDQWIASERARFRFGPISGLLFKTKMWLMPKRDNLSSIVRELIDALLLKTTVSYSKSKNVSKRSAGLMSGMKFEILKLLDEYAPGDSKYSRQFQKFSALYSNLSKGDQWALQPEILKRTVKALKSEIEKKRYIEDTKGLLGLCEPALAKIYGSPELQAVVSPTELFGLILKHRALNPDEKLIFEIRNGIGPGVPARMVRSKDKEQGSILVLNKKGVHQFINPEFVKYYLGARMSRDVDYNLRFSSLPEMKELLKSLGADWAEIPNWQFDRNWSGEWTLAEFDEALAKVLKPIMPAVSALEGSAKNEAIASVKDFVERFSSVFAENALGDFNKKHGLALDREALHGIAKFSSSEYIQLAASESGSFDKMLEGAEKLSASVLKSNQKLNVIDPYALFERIKTVRGQDQAFRTLFKLDPLLHWFDLDFKEKGTDREVKIIVEYLKWLKVNEPTAIAVRGKFFDDGVRGMISKMDQADGFLSTDHWQNRYEVLARDFFQSEVFPTLRSLLAIPDAARSIEESEKYLKEIGSFKKNGYQIPKNYIRRFFQTLDTLDEQLHLIGLSYSSITVDHQKLNLEVGVKGALGATEFNSAVSRLPKTLSPDQTKTIAYIISRKLKEGYKGSYIDVDQLFLRIFEDIKKSSELSQLFDDPKMAEQFYYDSTKKAFAEWYLEKKHEISKFVRHPTPPAIVRSYVDKVADTVNRLIHEPSAYGNDLIDWVEQELATTPAESEKFDKKRMVIEGLGKSRHTLIGDFVHIGIKAIRNNDERMQVLSYLIGKSNFVNPAITKKIADFIDTELAVYEESLGELDKPAKGKAEEIKKLIADSQFWGKMRGEFRSAPAMARSWIMMPILDPKTGLLSSPAHREQVMKLIMGELADHYFIRRAFETYLKVMPHETEARLVIAHVLGSFTQQSGQSKSRASLATILKAMGPFGIKMGQYLESSGILPENLREELKDFKAFVDPPDRPTVIRKFQEAFTVSGMDEPHNISWIGEIKGAASVNYFVRAQMINPEGNPVEVGIRFQRDGVIGRVDVENGALVDLENDLWEDPDPELKRFVRFLREARSTSHETLREGGQEVDLTFEVNMHEKAENIYKSGPATEYGSDYNFSVDVSKPLLWAMEKIPPHLRKFVSVYEFVDHVKFKEITDEVLAKHGIHMKADDFKVALLQQRLDTEFKALFEKGEFDPDSHDGNWLVDLKNRRQVRVDYSQLRFVSEPARIAFKNSLRALIQPLATNEHKQELAQEIEKYFFDVFEVRGGKPGEENLPIPGREKIPALIRQAVQSEKFPTYDLPYDRLLYIKDIVQKELFNGKDPRYFGVKDSHRASFALIARLKGYAEHLAPLSIEFKMGNYLGIDFADYQERVAKVGIPKAVQKAMPEEIQETIEEKSKAAESCWGRTVEWCKLKMEKIENSKSHPHDLYTRSERLALRATTIPYYTPVMRTVGMGVLVTSLATLAYRSVKGAQEFDKCYKDLEHCPPEIKKKHGLDKLEIKLKEQAARAAARASTPASAAAPAKIVTPAPAPQTP